MDSKLNKINTIINDRYQLISILGQGGMGRTYEAIDLENQQHVAVKIISLRQVDDWKKVELIEREAQVLQQLNHPNIPKYLDYFTIDTDEDKSFYLVQQLVNGQSLDIWRQEKGNLSEKQVKKIIRQVLRILTYLHNQTPPIIHRDIKPQNILINDNEQIYLVDFGAVQNAYYNTIVSENTIVGTYGYMPVEQSLGKVTPASDLYSLGATVLYLLTSRSPHELDDDNFKIDVAKCLENTKASPALIWWLEKMLEVDLHDRFNNATQALQAINNSYVLNEQKDKSQFASKGWRNIFIILMMILMSGSLLNKYKWFFLSRLGYYPQQVCQSFEEPAKTLIYYLNSGGKLNIIINEINTNPNCLASLIRHKENTIINQLVEEENFEIHSITPSLFKMLTVAEDVAMLQSLIGNKPKPFSIENSLNGQLSDDYSIEDLKLFINNGGNVNAHDSSGNTLLHKVTDLEIAQLLIDNGADVNAQNPYGHTPINTTSTDTFDNFEIVKLLINNGANVHIKDKWENTTLHLCDNSKVAELLIDKGVDVNAKNNKGNTALHHFYNYETTLSLISNGADVNARNDEGETPLHKLKYTAAKRLLIDNGADIKAKNNKGRTPWIRDLGN